MGDDLHLCVWMKGCWRAMILRYEDWRAVLSCDLCRGRFHAATFRHSEVKSGPATGEIQIS